MTQKPPFQDDELTVVWTPPEWVLEDEAAQGGDPPVEEAPAQQAAGFTESQRPDVEVEVRNVSSANALESQRRVFEIWTKNRVYLLNATMTCMEVIDLKTGTANLQHPFLGARLVGGQKKDSEANEISYPLPAPGSEAVFQKADPQTNRIRLSLTSPVMRVILHCQRVRVKTEEKDKAWGRLTGF